MKLLSSTTTSRKQDSIMNTLENFTSDKKKGLQEYTLVFLFWLNTWNVRTPSNRLDEAVLTPTSASLPSLLC